MKSDTERKKFYTEKIHKKKNRLHVHLSKDLRSRTKIKHRAFSIRKGDVVKVMRGPSKGKEAKISDVNVIRRKVFLEGIVVKNARGREVPVALEASNLLLLALEATPERKKIFSEEAFRKKEAPKKETPKPEQKAESKEGAVETKVETTKEHEHKGHTHKSEKKEIEKTEHKPEAHKHEQKPQGAQAQENVRK